MEVTDKEIDLSLYDNQIRYEDGIWVRRWIDKDGQPREASFREPLWECMPTHIEASWCDEPLTYPREYYRRIRRYRDGRTPRVADDAPTQRVGRGVKKKSTYI